MSVSAVRLRGASSSATWRPSTSTKNPSYPTTLYVDPLIGPDTVNTVPDATLEALGRWLPTLAGNNMTLVAVTEILRRRTSTP